MRSALVVVAAALTVSTPVGQPAPDTSVKAVTRAAAIPRYRSSPKRTAVEEYRLQGRGGTGIINLKVTDKTGPVVQVMEVAGDDQVMVITAFGKIIRTNVRDISILGRPTQGVRLIHLDEGDTVVAVARVAEGDADPAGEAPAGPQAIGGTLETTGGNGAAPEGEEEA